jgi:hypothetical protein
LKQQRDNKWPRFYQLDTGTRCTLFFSSSAFSPENVYHLAERMVESCQGDQQTRFLAKVFKQSDKIHLNLFLGYPN